MKAVQVVRHGRPTEVIEVRDVPEPEPGPGEVRVVVGAASLNFGDGPRTRGGVATVMAQPPFTLGMDVCGVVDAAGPGAEAWIGKRVVGMTKMAFGGMAEKAIVPVTGLFDAPAGLDDAEATAFLLPFHVGWLGLKVRARLQPGETLLVTGAASGVGTAAIQIGRALGARVIAVAGGAEKGAYCRSLGADELIDHASEALFDRVMALTDGRGVEVAYDLTGGDMTEQVWSCMALEGRYVPAGFNGDQQGGFTGRPLRKVSMGNFSVLGVMLAYGPSIPQMRKMGLNMFPMSVGQETHAALCGLIAEGKIRPAIGRRIRMDQVAATLEDHEQRKTSGRTVVLVGAAG